MVVSPRTSRYPSWYTTRLPGIRGPICCARRLQGTTPRRLAQRTELIILPGSPPRALAPTRATALSDWLLALVPRRPFPPPSGPPLLGPSFLSYPRAGAAVAGG